MAKCDKLIAACIQADCTNSVFTGVEQKAWIFNKADIEDFVYALTDPTDPDSDKIANKITEFQMVSGKKGYTVEQLGKTPYTGTTVELAEGTFGNTWTNTVQLLVPDNSIAASKDILDQLGNGKFVVVLENSYNGSDEESKFQVFGVKKGLTCSAMTNDKYSEDTLGGWQVTLTEEGSPNSAVFLYHTTTTTEGGETVTTEDTKEYLNTTLTSCN